MPSDLRTRKRLAMRQAISNAATRLFFARGFDHVTIDEIAKEADVGRMTVFNHFPRKEDMFFDRDDEARDNLLNALRQRAPEISPVEAFRLLAHRLIADKAPYVEFSARSAEFMNTIVASEALKARARQTRDELTGQTAAALAETTGQAEDANARLTASLLLATWSTAYAEALRTLQHTGDTKAANASFLALIDQGTLGVKAAMAGTPYA
ncbi:TetR family transcriptional regulator [Devosia epidermidihirudinis]|uniref:TetR family transcriptional regulator n=1 Tax=Devosia epidermidihirudinis TaxID=1293439 RepID=A0A0F5Q401_9HYPH|nr:TetR/AcrR family transcriptional regulator [Devosia epidermidihirudinis]KKC35648.1 TetR family transcriptional regulator [Devosia epidermidihirudinis]